MGTKKKGRGEKAPSPAVDPRVEAEVAKLLATTPPPDPAPLAKPVARRYTLAEVRAQVRAVEELLIDGARPAQIYRVLKGSPMSPGPHPEITLSRVRSLCDRVRTDWLSITKDDDRRAAREAAIRRLHRMRSIASGTRNNDGTWKVAPNHLAVARYEDLLMRLEGTEEASKVEVDVRFTQAMLSVTSQLSGDDASRFLDEAMEQRRLAEIARRELPALAAGPIRSGSVIEVQAEPASNDR